jgi:hypothetical protein
MEELDKYFWAKGGAILLAIVSPFVMLHYFPGSTSISMFWKTDFQPLFIFTNAATSYFLFSTEKWRLSAFFLLMLTAFSVEKFTDFHNFLALAFFLSNLYPLRIEKRFKLYFYFYAATLPIFLKSFLWGEIAAVIILCCYHLHLLIHIRMIHIKRQNS